MVMVIVSGLIVAVGLTGCAADPPDGPSIAELVDFRVNLTSTAVHVGSNKFVIRNNGNEEHEFIGFSIDGPVSGLPLTGDGNLDEEALTSITDGPNLAPGSVTTRTVEIPTPGTYILVCNLPGHFRRGMYTVVTVP